MQNQAPKQRQRRQARTVKANYAVSEDDDNYVERLKADSDFDSEVTVLKTLVKCFCHK
jgi:hypothetical protein